MKINQSMPHVQDRREHNLPTYYWFERQNYYTEN